MPKPLALLFALALLAAVGLVGGPAKAAEMRALIALDVGGRADLARALAVQRVLRERHGFEDVDVLTDVPPSGVFRRMKTFLEAPPALGERRLVWISGVGRAPGQEFCPARRPGAQPWVRPTAQSIVLAPECLSATLTLPGDALRIEQSSPTAARIGRYFRLRPVADGHPPLAVVPLPGHSKSARRLGDQAVFDVLQGAQGVAVRPLGFLTALRRRFPAGIGPYRPRLGLAHWHRPFQDALPRLDALHPGRERG